MAALSRPFPRNRVSLFAAILIFLLAAISSVPAQRPSVTSSSDETTWTNQGEPGYSLDGHQDASPPVDCELIGFWEHSDEHGIVTLEVLSESKLRLSGHESHYEIIPGAIRVTDETGEFDYPYQLVKDTLILTLSEDDHHPLEITFHRVKMSGLNATFSMDSARHVKRQRTID